MTRDLLALGDWLVQEGVTHAAMESTGVYWRPVYHLLEGRCQLLLVNAQHIKQVPGRKTDVKDCEWIAELLQHGLLRCSFVPPQPTAELRELTRHRTQLMAERARLSNRIQKLLEDANLKLGSVVSDVLGKSGRAMLEAITAGESDPEKLAELALGRMRGKIPRLHLALEGRVTEHHRFVLRLLLDQLASLERFIGRLEERAEVALLPFVETVERLKTIPGIDEQVARIVMAEMGMDLSVFPSAAHLASWVGICPGNDESAGKRRSGRITKGNRWLRQALVQAAWSASHTKNTYLSAQYHRLAGRRGKKRALIAIGHTLLVIIYHVLRTGKPYADLGADYFDRQNGDRLTRYLVKRLESLGHKVTLQSA
jgi:transposase